MLKLQQYIKNNKQLLIIYFIMLLFLVFHNKAYCDATLFQKWYLNLENYFLTLTWEKAISDPVELSKSIGWVSIGAIGTLYSFEWLWNARLLGSKGLYNYTPLGHLDDGSGIIKSWFGFRNTAGPLKNIIETVPYEEILPLYWARKYVFPNLFVKSNAARANPDNNQTNSIINNANLSNISRVEMISKGVQIDIAPTVITEYIEQPVYIPVKEYRDRENLQSLDSSVQALNVSAQDVKFSQNNQKTRDDLLVEINLLREHENAACLNLQNLSRNYETFKLVGVTDEQGFSLTPIKLKYLFFPKEESKLIKIYFDDLNFIALNKQSFSLKYPQIYLTLNTLTQTSHEYNGYRFSRNQIFEQYDSYVYFRYNETRTYFSYNFELDIPNCLIIEKRLQEKKKESYLLLKIEEIQSKNLEAAQSNLDLLVCKLNEKISNEQRLINIETQSQSTQTANFDLNETIFDRISSFLDVRDETSYLIASNEGRNLPFNNLPVKNCTKKEEILVTPTERSEISIQTEPVESYDVNNAITTIVQNPGMMFAATLGILAADNLHTIDAAVQILLGYNTFPAYNDAFIAATHMGVEDLQNTYNLTFHAAVRAQDLIGAAYDITNPETSMSELSSRLSDSNEYNPPKVHSYFTFKNLLIGGAALVGCYMLYNYVQSGGTVEAVAPVIKKIIPDVQNWNTYVLDEINKL